MTRRRGIRVPQRTCVGCRQVRPKREMIRVVRAPEAGVQIDPTGKRSGRGAYVCPQAACWEAALKRGHLERALKTRLTPQEEETLMAFGASCLGGPGQKDG